MMYLLIVGVMVLLIVIMAVVIGSMDGRRARRLPGSARIGNRTTRIAEAVVLLCAATALFVFTATNTSTGGRLLMLDQLSPEFAGINVIVAVIAACGVLLGVLAALLWRTSTGVILAAGILGLYGFILNGPEFILESLVPRDSIKLKASLRFVLSAPDVEGAELYVNGVHLGTLPYETTFEEFYRTVPSVKMDPEEAKQEFTSSAYIVPSWHPRGGRGGAGYAPWIQVTVEPPDAMHRLGSPGDRGYDVRVKLGDEWGFAEGGGRSHSGGSRYVDRPTVADFSFIFPKRQQRIEKLLDMARLQDYSPDPRWFATMETYRSDGWLAVRKAMDTEPVMSQLLDRWATWKYGLDNVTDASSAWKVFERIRAEADRRQCYITSDVTGRAVELLVPKLDPDKLVRLARDIIRSNRFYSWGAWQMNGRTQFGWSYSPEGLRTGAPYFTGYSAREGPSPGGYAVAHAVWMLDEMLDARDDTQPNIVERELVPTFIAYHYNNARLLKITAHIGGPAIDQYLLRQNWRARPEDLPWGARIFGRSKEVNGWLYLLANLPSPAGRQVRQTNERLLEAMADTLVGTALVSWPDDLDFLFLDLDCGSDSLAMKYWPQFKAKVALRRGDTLSLQFQYLVHMEPLSTPDMYAQCWREFRGHEVEFHRALDVVAKSSIPESKRQEICAALADCIERDASNIEDYPGQDNRKRGEYLLKSLKEELVPVTDPERAGDILAALRAGSPEYKPQNVADWLAYGAPEHPLVAMLAEANEPSLRLLAMGALREQPTPANRAILQKLLHDPDEQVRQAAEAVSAQLTALERPPLAQFTDTRSAQAVQ